MSERADHLSSRERELVEAAAEGRVLECSQLYPAQLANTGNAAHVIRAEVLRDLLLAQRCTPPDPRGVCLYRARITGSLDLTDLPALVGMELRGCWLDESIVLRDAHLPWLSLSGSRVPALVGDGLRVDGALLLREGFWATGGGRLGAVRLLGARIGAMTDLSDAQLIGQDWPPLIGDGLQIGGNLILRSCRITGRSKFGAIRLPGARIGGRLDLANAQLTGRDDTV